MGAALLLVVGALWIGSAGGCDRKATVSHNGPLTLTLDWKPEPEFGGFYQADLSGAFKKRGLDVQLKSAGAGAPTWQLVASGQTDFATTAGDQVLIARARGADVVALFAVFQTFPQGIMAHKKRGFKKIEDVFTSPGTLAAEDDAWLKYVLSKVKPVNATITGYTGGIATFMARQDYSQQCFVTSEPLVAQRQGGDPQTFLISDTGYNPYTTVLIARASLVKDDPGRVKAVVEACREGWRQYLDDPAAANTAMEKLNAEMDPRTFDEAAAAQRPLIENDQTRAAGLGSMTADRWNTLAQQLARLRVIETTAPAEQCFVDVDKSPAH